MTKTEKEQLRRDLKVLLRETDLPSDKRARLGAELRRQRNKAGINVKSAAADTGICQATLYNYESGSSRIPLEHARNLLKLYNGITGEHNTLDDLAKKLD